MKKVPFKYREDDIIREAFAYVSSTYGQHYVGANNVQSLDLIFSSGHGEGFCIGNATKYLARFGRKEGRNRKDLMKALHYVVLSIYVHDERERGERRCPRTTSTGSTTRRVRTRRRKVT